MKGFMNTHLHRTVYNSDDVKKGVLGWARHVAHMEETEKAYEPVIGKPEGIRPLC
jgi:hypothetical protein